jgi:hypothetical protein
MHKHVLAFCFASYETDFFQVHMFHIVQYMCEVDSSRYLRTYVESAVFVGHVCTYLV